ncbi:phytyl ester synthase 1, chloroplastic [Lactuca sativa]|uniref:phytyl ester synthase 1, chloroplastic n=1 Tax=Lactuca sativa TaxID=4236 RepID=UPI001C687FCA|nr:phytyl ester synthase 1, chloroplastic [Lactuca sativa]
MILTANSFWVPLPPHLALNAGCKSRSQVLVRSISGEDPVVLSESFRVDKLASVDERTRLSYEVVGKKRREDVSEKLEVLWDDGFGSESGKDFFKLATDIIKPDGGPPRWFCPISCGTPLKDSPVLLYLPGLDGTGLGLILHEKALGKVFEFRALHIPVQDRTPLEDLIKFVEESVRLEHASSPKKPIYLVGDSFGGCLALAVAAHNPTIDLVIILVNPATSFEKSRLPTFLFLLEALPNLFYGALSSIFLSTIRGLVDILPKDALIWRLKLLKSAASYANSHLHSITAEVLVLASYKDKLLPSEDEALRLTQLLKNCSLHFLKGKGHMILLENDRNLLTIIKGSSKYRRTSYHDEVKDHLPPSMSEYKKETKGHWLYHLATSPVMLSTMEDEKIVTGLNGIPKEGPVLFVGNHMLMGLDLFILLLQFLKEKKIILRGLGHPEGLKLDIQSGIPYISIILRVFGMLPVTPINFFKLFSTKSYVLLYPGGAREALHRKGEVHKLFWPEQQEFVRMAAKFGATIVPFGCVGEDDVSEMILDYNDWKKNAAVSDYLEENNEKLLLLRQDKEGEVANQQLHLPLVIPKIPGRFYYLFGKPIKTKGLEKILNDKENANALYLQIKNEVEKNIAYLIKKREEDPYRGFVKRIVYQAKTQTPYDQVPTFEP